MGPILRTKPSADHQRNSRGLLPHVILGYGWRSAHGGRADQPRIGQVQGHDGDVRRYDQLVGHRPSGPIHQEHGVRSGRDLGGDLIEMPLHVTGVAAGQDQGGTDTAFRAHGTKDAGRAGALILGTTASRRRV